MEFLKSKYPLPKKGSALFLRSTNYSATMTTDSSIPIFETANYNDDTPNIIKISDTQIRIKANLKYKLDANLVVVTTASSTSNGEYQFYNVTTSSYVGSKGHIAPYQFSYDYSGGATPATTILAPSVDTIIELRFVQVVNNVIMISSLGSSTSIEELEAYLPESTGSQDITGNMSISGNLSVNGWINGKIPLRDYIINGSFKYWLDNTGLSASSGTRYTATLIRTNASGNTLAASRGTHTVGQIDVPTNSPYYATFISTDSSGTGDYSYNIIYLEDTRKYASKTQTLSIWCRASTGTPYISIEGVQTFGSSGSPSSNITGISVQKIQLSTSWVRYDIPITWPSIVGKTFGTYPNSNKASIGIWFSAGSNFDARTNTLGHQAITVDIAKVQLVDGPVYQWIPEREENEELNLIYRYFYPFKDITSDSRLSFIGMAYNSTIIYAPVRLPILMRVSPAISYVGNFRTLPGGASVSMSYVESSPNSFTAVGTGTGYTSASSYILQTSDNGNYYAIADARF